MGHQIYSASSYAQPYRSVRTPVRAVAYGSDQPGPLWRGRPVTGTEFACRT